MTENGDIIEPYSMGYNLAVHEQAGCIGSCRTWICTSSHSKLCMVAVQRAGRLESLIHCNPLTVPRRLFFAAQQRIAITWKPN
jgi:hypothetical protein